MNGTEVKKISRKTKLIIVAVSSLLIIALFVTMTLRYINNFSDALLEENANYLSEISEHIAVNVDVVIENMQRSLETVGLTIAGGKRDDKNRTYLNSIRKKYNFEYVGIALPDGILHATMNSEEKDIRHDICFQKAIKGESVVEYVPVKVLADKVISGLLISAPVYDLSKNTERPIGVLVAMLDMKNIANSVNIAGFGGQGSTFIIDGNGEILLQTKQLGYSNLYMALSNTTFTDGYSLNLMKEELKEQRDGFAAYSDFGVEKFVHYRALGTADWRVVSVIEKDIITAKTTQLTRELLAIGIAVLVLFPLLLVIALSSVIASRANRQAAQTKSAFLANMSHEIRTPMNAIVGISEIMLREDITEKQKNYVLNIVSSGNGLLTIINDILDFSKIESGKFNIVEEEYELESLIYDVVAVIGVRIGDKSVRFLVDVDPDLPKYLFGDMIRVKQVLTNILGNAAKFTNSGYIKLGIHGKIKDGQITLTMPVEDTGVGIRKDDLHKLFASFSQVDTHRNRSIEGTGLGLAISQRLCELMGGNITVESTYGVGSTFTIQVQQSVTRADKLTQPPKNEHARLLILEPSETVRQHFAVCLDRLHLAYTFCEDFDTFFAEVQAHDYTHALADRNSLHRLAEESPVLPELTPIALVGLKDSANVQDYIHTIIWPLFTLQLAAILGDAPTQATRLQRGGIDILAIHPMPFVRVLIVDDIEVNLQVANGLMAPYHMHVDCATSGKSSIKMIEEHEYDLVFMDHMMPEMDGTETVKLIRAQNSDRKNVPVVALTANITHGAREIFLQAGFNDFLSKPIDTVQLNAILKKWLKDLNESREKENPTKARAFYETLSREEYGGASKIPEEQLGGTAYVDFGAGIDNLGNFEVYSTILTTYSRTARDKLRDLPLLLDTDLEKFTIEVHGLKGASGGIYATLVATAAEKLEHLAKEKKLNQIRKNLPELLYILQNTLDDIEHFIVRNGSYSEQLTIEHEQPKKECFSPTELLMLKEAFWIFDSDKIESLFADFAAFCYEERERYLLDELKKKFVAYDFDTPIQLIEEYEQSNQKGDVDTI